MYQLAVMAGEWDVVKIERGMTAKRFLEWTAYSNLEPFGEMRADYRAASIRETVFNVAVAAKHRRPFDDFLLKFGGAAKPKQSWQEKLMVAHAICAVYAAGIKD